MKPAAAGHTNMNTTEHNFDFDEIQQGEEWLAGVATPAPSARALTSTKAAMRMEFVRLGRRSGGVARWQAWHGALAAAACIALCVTVGWRMYGIPGSNGASREMAGLDMTWPLEVETKALAYNELNDELTAIEEAVRGESDETVDGALLYDVLSDAVSGADADGPAGSSLRPQPRGSHQSEDTI